MSERELIHCRSPRRRCHLLTPWFNVEIGLPLTVDSLHRVGRAGGSMSTSIIIMYEHRFGELVDWEEAAAHRSDILGYPRARLVLEAQAFIMSTLRAVVDKILDGVDDSTPARTEKLRELTGNAAFRRTGEVEAWSPYTNQAFSAPPILDIEYLLSLAKTRLDATDDHLRHLQCDPAYMRRHMKMQSRKSLLKIADQDEAAIHLAYDIYVEVLGHYWWHWIETECKNVADLHRRFRDSIYQGQPLPPLYERGLGALELFISNQVIYRANMLYQIIRCCPGFSQHWTVSRNTDAHSGYAKLERKGTNNTKTSKETPLIGVLCS
ncbi:uncharacterized protein F4822DRAFT_298291 [Hypoxylon trugodes]|uniref:uncharacterized protein n=1 Tax=Hypoxylon trugodes TaxID=326681 RepID=UPI0021A22715|nr:uncharacterized protein F4822DRAFT_298291 [Hypoxylon trugodes]KAI1387980.1 hypothetical protein F4822DRAFT_298291 [Hypoxylon trugodes]